MSHIALVTYEMNQGGTNRVLCELANGFSASGHHVTIISCTSAGALDASFRKTLSPDVGYVALSNTAWSSRSWGQVRTFLKLLRWINDNRPEIVLATGNNISWLSGLGAFLARAPKPRFFVKTTNPIVRSRDSAIVNWIRRSIYGLLFRKSDGVMTLSDAETRLLQGQFPLAADKFSTVYNAYVTDRHEGIGGEIGPPLAPPRIILSAGRLAAQKNFFRLLEAFSLAMKDKGDVAAELHIAGDGEEKALLEEKVRALGIADRVKFLGFRSDVPQLMAQAHLFVLSSDYEGLPAVVVEALAANCPVIATDCFANARDLLDNLPGCAVCEVTSEDLAGAIRRWLSAPLEKHDLTPYASNYTSASSVKSHLAVMERV